MSSSETILKQLHAALERDPRIHLHRYPIRIDLSGDGNLFLEGEVESVAAKKRTLALAGSLTGVREVTDRLKVHPAEHRGDGAIRDSLCAFMLQEPTLQNCGLRVSVKGEIRNLREVAENASGLIEIAVDEGVVVLSGEVLSLSHKRLAEVMAWWTPGCCDVINTLNVVPPEQDEDDEVADALQLVWEKDPLVADAHQLRAHVDHYVVTLQGIVPREAEKKAAELDAWCLSGVKNVVNNIEVRK